MYRSPYVICMSPYVICMRAHPSIVGSTCTKVV
jgi:hypothetical protein